MQRRQRNKIAALPAQFRQIVMQGLLDGEIYDAIRDELRGAGVTEDEIPGNKAFKAYQSSDEYREVSRDFRTWKRKAASKNLLAQALEQGGGLSSAIDTGLYQAYEVLLESMSLVETVKDVTALSNAMSNLKRTALAAEAQQMKMEAAKAVARAKAKLEEQQGVEVTPAAACEAVQQELDRVLGVK